MNLKRRDILIGGSCLLGAGAAWALTPRRRVTLMTHGSLAGVVPRAFPGWVSQDVGNLVAPKEEDSLSAQLYQETIERVYRNADGVQIMVLMAHGDTQSNELQLHRPEVCYPAFGYAISRSRALDLPLASGVTLPARTMVAEAPNRRENILYWSRLGEFMPVNGGEQRMYRLKTAMDGYIADGLLARFSVVGTDQNAAVSVLEGFITALIRNVPAAQRQGLIGAARAKALAAAGV